MVHSIDPSNQNNDDYNTNQSPSGNPPGFNPHKQTSFQPLQNDSIYNPKAHKAIKKQTSLGATQNTQSTQSTGNTTSQSDTIYTKQNLYKLMIAQFISTFIQQQEQFNKQIKQDSQGGYGQ